MSLDLDNKWSYMKTHGDPGWETFPSYLDLVVPRVLDFLQARGHSITFFVVGQDAAIDGNRDVLRAIADAGHEIGNHSFKHEPWLHLYSDSDLEAELDAAEESIERATGRKPIGFRGPGYSFSDKILRSLANRGYLYDASTFPSFLGPLARAYYFATAKLEPEERERRKVLFGSFSEGFRTINPHRIETGSGPIVEVPVTTMPWLKLPIHASYLIYLSTFSRRIARAYFRTALWLCRVSGTTPSILLHPLDFLGSDDVTGLDFFPGMRLTGAQKLAIMAWIFDDLETRYTLVSLEKQVAAVFTGSAPANARGDGGVANTETPLGMIS